MRREAVLGDLVLIKQGKAGATKVWRCRRAMEGKIRTNASFFIIQSKPSIKIRYRRDLIFAQHGNRREPDQQRVMTALDRPLQRPVRAAP